MATFALLKAIQRVRAKIAVRRLRVLCTIFASLVLFSGQIEAGSGSVTDVDTLASALGQSGKSIDPKLEGFKLVHKFPKRVPYGEGERLTFAIQYGLIYAGDATMEIRNIAIIDTTKAYHIISSARTNEAFDVIYKVRDRVESFMDYYNLFSIRFEKHLREGRYRKDESVIFDQKKHFAIYKDKKIKIAPNTQDFLSALYYIRTIDLEVGEAIAMANHTAGKNYPIYVKVLRKEHVSVPAGEFDCIVIEPVLQTSSIFEQRGRLTIWLTDDNLKMPVLMRSKVIVGAFEAVLKEYVLSKDEIRFLAERSED